MVLAPCWCWCLMCEDESMKHAGRTETSGLSLIILRVKGNMSVFNAPGWISPKSGMRRRRKCCQSCPEVPGI